MTVVGFGVQLLRGETYHLIEPVRLSPPWTCHYSHLMKNPAVSLNSRLTYHQPKSKMGMGRRWAQIWGGESVDLVEVAGRQPWKRDWGRAGRRPWWPWWRALHGQRQVRFEAATSSYGLVACRCSPGQTVRGRAATAGACVEGGDGLRTSKELHPRRCQIQ
jgi:hypothetical protein